MYRHRSCLGVLLELHVVSNGSKVAVKFLATPYLWPSTRLQHSIPSVLSIVSLGPCKTDIIRLMSHWGSRVRPALLIRVREAYRRGYHQYSGKHPCKHLLKQTQTQTQTHRHRHRHRHRHTHTHTRTRTRTRTDTHTVRVNHGCVMMNIISF